MKIEVYSRENCVQCNMAKNLLKSKCVDFEEKLLDEVENTVTDLKKRIIDSNSNKPATMLPQIFIDDNHIGSFNDLKTFVNEQSLGCEA